jgi:protein-tyrosine-phosphatase
MRAARQGGDAGLLSLDIGGSGAMTKSSFNVLFLCTGNSARSIMAECILNREGKGRFHAFSAGSQPKGAVHPFAIDLLRRTNYATAGLRSKIWEEFAGADAPALDFVSPSATTPNEVCPVWPGQPMTAHWGVADPAAEDGSETLQLLAFADSYRMLANRIGIFVNLPMESLDRLSLQKRLNEIGRSLPKTA